jgi:hypothetical protein
MASFAYARGPLPAETPNPLAAGMLFDNTVYDE